MKKMSLKILLAINFSQKSKYALQFLKSLKKFYKLDLILVHVLPSFWKDWLSSGLYQKEAFQRLKLWQKNMVDEEKEGNLSVKYGNPANVILEEAESRDVDLIVLGGRSEERENRYDTSIALESVVRSAKQSVWVTQGKAVSKILCGVDGSESSAKTLEWALEIARRFSVPLCVVHALPQPDFNPLGMDDSEIKAEEKKFEKEKTQEIEDFLSKFDFSEVKSEKKFLWGSPANVILDLVEDERYDLIVMGAKGHSMLHYVFLGSVTEKVVRHARCSLLVVR